MGLSFRMSLPKITEEKIWYLPSDSTDSELTNSPVLKRLRPNYSQKFNKIYQDLFSTLTKLHKLGNIPDVAQSSLLPVIVHTQNIFINFHTTQTYYLPPELAHILEQDWFFNRNNRLSMMSYLQFLWGMCQNNSTQGLHKFYFDHISFLEMHITKGLKSIGQAFPELDTASKAISI